MSTGGLYQFSEILTTTCVSSLAYAFHICIATSTFVVLAKQRKQNPHRVAHGIFVALLFLLGTINIGVHLDNLVDSLHVMAVYDNWGVESIMWMCFDPGWQRYTSEPSPLGCVERELRGHGDQLPYTPKPPVLLEPGFDRMRGQEIPALFISILAQSYLLLRCHSLWGKRFVTVAMGVLLPVVISFGVLNIYFLPEDMEIISPAGAYTFWLEDIPMYDLARVYWGLALGYNISANALIVGRLLWLRAKVTSAIGKVFGKVYTGLAAMLMESSMLYSVVLILGYTLLPGDGGSASMFSPLVAQTETIAAELIILRLALGRALSRREVVTVTAMPDESTKPDPNSSNVNGTTSLLCQARRLRISRTVGARDTVHSTFSLFPSSVAAVLRSYYGDETGPQRSADATRLENTRSPHAGTSNSPT